MSTTEWHGDYGGDDPTIDEYDEMVAHLRIDADAVQTTAHDVPLGALIWAGRTIREQADEIERLRKRLDGCSTNLRLLADDTIKKCERIERLEEALEPFAQVWRDNENCSVQKLFFVPSGKAERAHEALEAKP